MFNDRFGLTQAVLDGRKTQTRRIIKTSDAFERVNPDFDWSKEDIKAWNNDFSLRVQNMSESEKKRCFDYLTNHSKFKVGEVVAVAQSYSSIVNELEDCNNASCAAHYEKNIEKVSGYMFWLGHPGFTNKMFTSPELMLHLIRITNVRIERLQDISDEDCLQEGVINKWHAPACKNYYYIPGIEVKSVEDVYDTAKEAFARLIDKVIGKGTWERNPHVFVYDFELIK